MKATRRLRELLAQREPLVLPGVYDGLTARLAEQFGYSALYMTGAGTAAAHGFPDYGLVTMSEMVDTATVVARSVTVPIVADADTGYGNELNVTRTVREYEARGLAGLHIEDQAMPKRCGHLDGKELVARDVFLGRIRAAVEARRDDDFLIIARSDARSVEGLDEAIERVNAAFDVGADMAFVESPYTLKEVAAIPERVKGPCLLNVVPGGKTPIVSVAQARDMGYRMMLMPGVLLAAQIVACGEALRVLKETGKAPSIPLNADVMQAFRVLGAAEWDELRSSFQAPLREAEAHPASAS
jgi:2-methylisocitrate lyase-like PEP mutase family enzyme